MNESPQEQVTFVSMYGGCMSFFKVISSSRLRDCIVMVAQAQFPLKTIHQPQKRDRHLFAFRTQAWIRPKNAKRCLSLFCVLPGFLDLCQELLVALGLLDAIDEDLDRGARVERVQHPAQLPDVGRLRRFQDELFLARPGLLDVYCGEDALVSELAVEVELHVAGALELLEDDLIHPASGIHQSGGDDSQASAELDVARGAEEPLGREQRGGVDAARQDAPARRSAQVVSPGEPGHGVEQYH